MKILIVINDAPYGDDRPYNALRTAMTLQKEHDNVSVKVFLFADAIFCAKSDQKTSDGQYNIERMIKSILSHGAEVKVCSSCAAVRGINESDLIPNVQLSNMKEFTQWVIDSDKILSF